MPKFSLSTSRADIKKFLEKKGQELMIDWSNTQDAYDAIIRECRELMLAKNHDYGESWRDMRITSLTDQILVKVKRIQRLEDLQIRGEKPKISEGLESEYRDILNYCVFALIKLKEQEE